MFDNQSSLLALQWWLHIASHLFEHPEQVPSSSIKLGYLLQQLEHSSTLDLSRHRLENTGQPASRLREQTIQLQP